MSNLDEKRQLVLSYMSVKYPNWTEQSVLACLLMDAHRCGYGPLEFEEYLDAVIEQQGLGE